ncbi:diguanylate cyclase [Arthrobacter sp. RIT-PI-e]|uniref:GGDEF domain-containing protein n=1 Tax=Arthrobacter sp. RIT-PI-e TaxID=1681197 RepID=UPI0006763357|nr:GGDEF domain-containing protein [Arthrobacter sp. RIT-PI-e]KNC16326.1 diguanylate cyclase [Arthrobacter sp. RIT-PI-e]
MELDIGTLRVVFGAVSITLFILFYSVSFRQTGSVFSAWWCAAVAFFLMGSSGYLLDGTVHQIWANPTANTLLVAGTSCVWAGARSLRHVSPAWSQLAVAPVLTLLASVVDDPATNTWSGGPVFLGMMCLTVALASWELWRLPRNYSRVQTPLAVATGCLALLYLGRCLAFVGGGKDGHVFTTYFGSEITALLTLLLLVVVAFSAAALSAEQIASDLRTRASRDVLTGLLNRGGFQDLAEVRMAQLGRTSCPGTLVLADLDHFKAVNDTYGHAAGDAVLKAFATAAHETVRSTDLVARYGGEEFVILLPGASLARTEEITRAISSALRGQASLGEPAMPTVSYGIAAVDTGDYDLDAVIAAADQALYAAKSGGRDRTVRAIRPAGAEPGSAAEAPRSIQNVE